MSFSSTRKLDPSFVNTGMSILTCPKINPFPALRASTYDVQQECFPFDYLTSHDILLEFWLLVLSDVEQLSDSGWAFLTRLNLLFETILRRNQNPQNTLFGRESASWGNSAMVQDSQWGEVGAGVGGTLISASAVPIQGPRPRLQVKIRETYKQTKSTTVILITVMCDQLSAV